MDNIFNKYQIKKDRVSDKIIAVLEKAVLKGDLKQGDKLPTEEKIAAQFKVSKVAVREALREMEAHGLIRKERGMYGGNFVSAPDVKRVGDSMISCFQFGTLTEKEIIDFRYVLEPVLIRRAAQLRTDEDLAAMKAHIEECEEDLKNGTPSVKKHIAFHILIARACHNKLFSSVIEAIAEIFEDLAKGWQEDKKKMRGDLDFNYKFYDCIRDGKADEAEKLMKEHFNLTKVFRRQDRENEKNEKNS
ncbi:MAG: FadR family transcriptional regulator [Desulfobacteraceae bacterium]|nr:FadR family transcriptional regulator [Desulfobacteraceae bacterium]